MSFYGSGRELDMLHDAMEAAGIAWWMMEYPSGTVFFAPNKIKMLGYTEADTHKFIHFSHFTELIHPDDYGAAMTAMRGLFTGATETYEARYRIRNKTGTYVTFYDKGKIVGRDANGDLAIAGIVMDISKYVTNTGGVPIVPLVTPAI